MVAEVYQQVGWYGIDGTAGQLGLVGWAPGEVYTYSVKRAHAVQIHTAMAELSLLTEEFPDEADSSMLWTLRVKLEKELAATIERQAQVRLRQQVLPAQGSGTASPLEDAATTVPPDAPAPAHSLGAAGPSDRAGPLDREVPGPAGSAAVPQGAPCRPYRGVFC